MLTTYFGRSTAGALERCMNLYLHIFFLSFFFFLLISTLIKLYNMKDILTGVFLDGPGLPNHQLTLLRFIPLLLSLLIVLQRILLRFTKRSGLPKLNPISVCFSVFSFPFFFL